MGDSHQVDLTTLVASLRALVISRKAPATVSDILVDYQEIEGEPLQVNCLGFDTVEEFLQASGKFNFQRKNGELYVVPKSQYQTAHIERMVKKQKSSTSTKKLSTQHQPPDRAPTPPPPTPPPVIVILSSSEEDDASDNDLKPPKRIKLIDRNRTPSPPIICILSSDEEEEEQQKQEQKIPVQTKRKFNRRRRYFPRRRRPRPYPYYRNNRDRAPPPPRIGNITLHRNFQPNPWNRRFENNELEFIARTWQPPPAPHISSWPRFRPQYPNGSAAPHLWETGTGFHGNFAEYVRNYGDVETALRLALFCLLRNIPAPSYKVYTIPYRPGYFCSLYVNQLHYSTNGRSYLNPFRAQVACAQVALQNIFEWNL